MAACKPRALSLCTAAPFMPDRTLCRRNRNVRPVQARSWGQGSSEPLVGVPTQPLVPPIGAPGGAAGPGKVGLVTGIVMGFQAAALIGAVTTGVLARRRRTEMQALNEKLRQINAELRRQREAQESILSAVGLGAAQEGLPPGSAAAAAATAAGEGGGDAAGGDGDAAGGLSSSSGIQAAAALEALERQRQLLQQERSALEAALSSPAAAHPTEAYGEGGLSIARARRQIAQCIRGSKELVRDGRPGEVFPLLDQGLKLAADTSDVRAERALIRVRARALRETGDPAKALADLQRSLVLSQELGESCGDADTFGEMGDLLTELGDLETAGAYYDKCILAIQNEAQQPLSSSTWDV